MPVVNRFGTRYMNDISTVGSRKRIDADVMHGEVRCSMDSVEVMNGDSIGSVYSLARVPTSARLLPQSQVFWDDLSNTGSPTLSVGLFPVNDNFVAQPTVLSTNAVFTNTAGLLRMYTDPALTGLRVWEILGLARDPGGFADIKCTVASAAVAQDGTVSMSVLFTDG